MVNYSDSRFPRLIVVPLSASHPLDHETVHRLADVDKGRRVAQEGFKLAFMEMSDSMTNNRFEAFSGLVSTLRLSGARGFQQSLIDVFMLDAIASHSSVEPGGSLNPSRGIH